MKIAVIGTGNIGSTLGGRWRAAGHDVVYGSRAGSGDGPGGAPLTSVAEELITAVGLEPVYAGDASASGTVDALLPLWFALVKHNGGTRRVGLRITR
jgi:predicted dinucleotide-binding enzyme